MPASTAPTQHARLPIRRVTVSAPSRLHFGLLRVAGGERRFGGAGVMLESPRVLVECEPHDSFAIGVDSTKRISDFVDQWSRFHDEPLPPIRISLHECPPQHSGLGVGTQMGLAVAAALNAILGLPEPPPEQLARSVGRGKRSAVGAYGFRLGGFIVERGKTDRESLSPLDLQIDLPEEWRFSLIRPTAPQHRVHGAKEAQIFASLRSPKEQEQRLIDVLRNELAPAAAQGDFTLFANSVEQYGRLAGECFADIQGGPYNGPRLNELVAHLKTLGGKGLGQSSWGPTLFACHESAADATQFLNQVHESLGDDVETSVSAVNAGGASTVVEYEERVESPRSPASGCRPAS